MRERKSEVEYSQSLNRIVLTSGSVYTAVGGEMTQIPDGAQPYLDFNSALIINGTESVPTAYAINSSNYFKLRDLGRALGFNVSYIDGRIVIASDEPYSDAQ